jgi:predicted nucleic acid-binding protein
VYVLDSDVLTIISGSRNNANVTTWYNSLDETQIYMSVIAIFEQSKNAASLAKNRKPDRAIEVEKTLAALKGSFANRILALDVEAAEDWGRMIGKQEKHIHDAATAAISRKHNYIVATRNVDHYIPRGVTVINPYVSPPVIKTA